MIRNFLERFTFLLQLLSAAVVLFIVYMVAAILTNIEFDMIAAIGFLIIHPILASLLILGTFVLCLLAGLPLRKSKRVASWWRARQIIPLFGIFIAFLLLLSSFLPGFAEIQKVELDEVMLKQRMPNSTMVVIGWFLLAFCMLHFYPLSLADSISAWLRKMQNRMS